MPMPIDIAARATKRLIRKRSRNLANEKSILVSGCLDSQTSADAYLDGNFYGAMTFTMLEILRKNPNMSWTQLKPKLQELCKQKGFSQIPQVAGGNLLSRIVFN